MPLLVSMRNRVLNQRMIKVYYQSSNQVSETLRLGASECQIRNSSRIRCRFFESMNERDRSVHLCSLFELISESVVCLMTRYLDNV